MDKRRLGVFQTHGAISSQAEVGILINSARDQAGNLRRLGLILAEDVREGGGE